MKFWNRLRWFALICFLLMLVALATTESTTGPADMPAAPKFPVNP